MMMSLSIMSWIFKYVIFTIDIQPILNFVHLSFKMRIAEALSGLSSCGDFNWDAFSTYLLILNRFVECEMMMTLWPVIDSRF